SLLTLSSRRPSMLSFASTRRNGRRSRPLRLELLEERALPSFLPAVPYPVGAGPVGLAVGDWNGDDYPDLVIAVRDGTVAGLRGTGDGSFHPRLNFPAAQAPTAVAGGDLNHDGNNDVVVAAFDPGVSVLLGNGDGSFRSPLFHPIPGVGRTASVAVGDFNE